MNVLLVTSQWAAVIAKLGSVLYKVRPCDPPRCNLVTDQTETCYELRFTADVDLKMCSTHNTHLINMYYSLYRWMLWLPSATSVSSTDPGRCFAPRLCTLHLRPLHPRLVLQCQGTGTVMVTGKVKVWPWGPTAQPRREERCVMWVKDSAPFSPHV